MKTTRLLLIGLLIFLVGCEKEPDNIWQQDEPVKSRISIKSQNVPVVPGFGMKSAPEETIGYEFTLVAEVDAPEVNGKTVQATHVEIVQNWALVSYNMQGSEQLGAIDIIDIANPEQPVMVNSITFDNMDVNSIGWLNDHLVIAGQDAEGALYGFYSLDNDTLIINRLLSYSAVSMIIENNLIYVVSGDNGGLTVIDTDGNEDYWPFADARSVALNSDDIFVLTSEMIFAENGTDITLDPGLLQLGSKADLDISDQYLFAALNRGGVHIYELDDHSLFQTIDRPLNPEGQFDEDYVTNSVSYNDPLLFVANGGAGILVSGKSDLFDKSDPEFVTYGYFDFDGPLSSNFVKSQGNYVFVASGLGGLKILTIEEIADDCNWSSETAFAGSEQGSGSAWWYYIDNTSKSQHPIYAGQELVEGAHVEINPVNGTENVELIIELGSNMILQDVSEAVKIQGYCDGYLPASRPPAGQFTTYKGNELSVEIPNYAYYVVHLDVKVCK
jgi:hypothetical protein